MTVPGAVQRVTARFDALSDLALPMPPLLAVGGDLRGDHPGFALHARAREDALAAVDRGETRYVDGAGIAPLREAIAAVLARAGMTVDPQHGILVTAGEQEARFLALHTLVGSGILPILLPSVVHPGARKASALIGAPMATFPLDPRAGVPDGAAVRAAVQARPRAALYVESPNRLTGKVLPPDAVHALVEESARADAFIIWDASMAGWLPSEIPYLTPAALPEGRHRTVVIGTVWPGAGVESWMIAYLAVPADLYPHARRVKQVMALCTSVPVQWGMLGLLGELDAGRGEQLRALDAVMHAARQVWPGEVFSGETLSVMAVASPRGTARASPAVARGMGGDAFGVPGCTRFAVTPTGEIIAALRDLARGGSDSRGGRRGDGLAT